MYVTKTSAKIYDIRKTTLSNHHSSWKTTLVVISFFFLRNRVPNMEGHTWRYTTNMQGWLQFAITHVVVFTALENWKYF